MRQFCFRVLPLVVCVIATAVFLLLSVEASLQAEYVETHRRIDGLTEALEYLEDEGQITIHVNDWDAGEVDHYDSPAQALAWGSHHRLGTSIAEQQLPTIYLIAAGLSAVAAAYIYAFGPRSRKIQEPDPE